MGIFAILLFGFASCKKNNKPAMEMDDFSELNNVRKITDYTFLHCRRELLLIKFLL